MAMGVNVIGSSNEAGDEAGRSIGLVPGDMPGGTTPTLGPWPMAHVAVEMAEVTAVRRIEEPHVRVLALGVRAI